MSAPRLALAASLLLAACGSSRPADSTADSTAPLGEPADAGVSIGRPSSGDAGVPDLPAKVVRHGELEALRVSGDPTIEPDEGDRAAMATGGKKAAAAAVKYCVDTSGHVARVRLLRSTGLARYDQKILSSIRTWTFRPMIVEGQPTDVCTVVTFLWRPSSPAAPAP